METSMAELVETETQTTEPRRHYVRPALPASEDKEIKRRKRFDSVLNRYVTPEERDELRAYLAAHNEYPKKYAKEIEAADALRVANKRAADAKAAAKAKSIGVIAKPASAPKPATGAEIFTARMFAADLASTFTKEIADLPAEVQLRALELFERKFLEYKNK